MTNPLTMKNIIFPNLQFKETCRQTQLGRIYDHSQILVSLQGLPHVQVKNQVPQVLDGRPGNEATQIMLWLSPHCEVSLLPQLNQLYKSL